MLFFHPAKNVLNRLLNAWSFNFLKNDGIVRRLSFSDLGVRIGGPEGVKNACLSPLNDGGPLPCHVGTSPGNNTEYGPEQKET